MTSPDLYGFDQKNPEAGSGESTTIKLPPMKDDHPKADADIIKAQLDNIGKAHGFVTRDAISKRKTGPKRTEPQGKLTLTGPTRVLDDLQAYCDELGGVPYWKAIETLLGKR